MKVARGELIGVTGEVGSGKSQFLQALVGEAPCRFEKLQVFDRTIVSEEDFNLVRPFFCLLSQESFLISSSLRDNLNLNYDTTRDLDPWIEESLEKVQFETDQINFPSRLSTEVGERGVNLSGGQKQRLNLARILHKGNTVEQIYLIDDCLNQLDADTSQKVFAEMFQVTLRGFTIFLVSQKPEILKKCDRILFLEDGSVEGFADYDSLSSQSLKFQKLMLMEVHEKNL
jgi:ABC-type multidrug transport system fused ATPase/permease subunit